MPDAGGLVIAGDHDDARAYAALLRGLTGKRPVVVLSDDKTASKKISPSPPRVTAGWSRCGWCLRAWTSRGWPSACTRPACPPRCSSPRRSAGSSGPAAGRDRVGVPPLGSRAADLRRRTRGRTGPRAPAPAGEADEEDLLAEAERQRDTPDTFGRAPSRPSTRPRTSTGCCTTAGSSAPPRGRLAGGRGLPRPARPAGPGPGPHPAPQAPDAQLAARSRDAAQPARPPRPPVAHQPPGAPAPPVNRQALAALRKELNGLVGAWSHRTGQPHGVIHAELRRTCGGPRCRRRPPIRSAPASTPSAAGPSPAADPVQSPPSPGIWSSSAGCRRIRRRLRFISSMAFAVDSGVTPAVRSSRTRVAKPARAASAAVARTQ